MALMNNTSTKQNLLKQLIYRPFWIAIACLIVILSIALSLLINTSWRALHRTEPLEKHLLLIEKLQRYNTELNRLSSPIKSLKKPLTQFTQLHKSLTHTLRTSADTLSDEAKTALRQANNALQKTEMTSTANFLAVKENLHTALHAEIDVQAKLLRLLARDNRLELETATSIAIALPLLGLLMLFFLRHRILKPLNGLSMLISRLGLQSIPPIPLDEVNPLLQPLFIDFNRLIKRLSRLEQAQLKHQQKLENKVRNATQSLLEYHHTLAQSERLAAVGELTAGLAHELRNPLAGIYLALNNLRNEIGDDDKASRLALVLEELDRVTTLLNQVLTQSQHSPEPATYFNLADMLASLLRLVQYQIPSRIKIKQRVPKDIQCHLPQGRLRQSILNLILNAAQSLNQAPGLITIEAHNEKDSLVIRIQDNGPGFPKKLLASGIQPFVTSRNDGTGLGLAIVRRFCHEQGGTLELTNPPEGGACIQITLGNIKDHSGMPIEEKS
ncbi:MAG TPA: two-component sensor histidine kinase [Gammaproteobacteria bacterium]|nr:two-component sensor histidine kinase [Gammaproteobacteria bacterium]